MPPRGRSVKKNSRMAAAVENMTHMGFDMSLVKSTVQELLKLYTEDGWNLIEEHSYEVLRVALLKKTASPPQGEEQEPPELLQQQEGEGDGGFVVAESSVGSLHMAAAIENHENANTKAAEETEGEAPSSPRRKQMPYYGWISNSQDEAAADREIIELPSMPLDVFEEMWSFLPSELEV